MAGDKSYQDKNREKRRENSRKYDERIRGVGDLFSMRQFGKELKSLNGKYSDEVHPRMAYIVCSEMGADNEGMCKLFGISASTLIKWMKIHSKFRKYIRMGRDAYDTKAVEKILIKKAIGYKRKSVQIKYNKEGEIVSKIVSIEEVPADVKAIMFWLRNRNPERWPEMRDLSKLIAQKKADALEYKKQEMRQIEGGASAKMSEAAAGVAKVLMDSGVIDLNGKVRRSSKRAINVVDADYVVENIKVEDIEEVKMG